VLREGTHRVPDRRVYPRTAHIYQGARQVNRVQPTTDPIASLNHYAVNPGVPKSVRDRQSGDPRAHHHHTLNGPRHPHRNIRLPVVETLSGQPGHPSSAEGHMLSPRHHRPSR
jgi:hypothetical protein